MGAPKLTPKITVDQYLALERASSERHEYLDGVIYAMAGESEQHGDITFNLPGLLFPQLRGTPCRGRTKDTKVRSGPFPEGRECASGLYSYPDIVVVCGERQFHDAFKDVVLNPTAIFEVLSPSTEVFDRGEKFIRYQKWNPTLRDYVLISQDKPQIEHYRKQEDGTWSYRLHTELESSVAIPSIGCTLKLAEVYERIVFTTLTNTPT